MPFDPYEELGVPRDASTADVRKAYRKRAKKLHPDVGGNADDFDRARRAMSVLNDPARREKFDNTGNADDSPDNTRSGALQVIEKHMGDLVGGFIAGNGRDPRQVDVIAHIKACIDAELKECAASLAKGKQAVEFINDMLGRLKVEEEKSGDPLGLSLLAHIAHAQQQMDNMQVGIAQRKMALKIISNYSFRYDPAAPAAGQQGFVFTVRIV